MFFVDEQDAEMWDSGIVWTAKRRSMTSNNNYCRQDSGRKVATSSTSSISPIPHTRLDDSSGLEEIYTIGRKLGEGSYGKVREVMHKTTGERWACKAVNKEKAGSSAIKLLEREVAILKQIRHDHTIRLKEVFETAKKMYLIMEYCEGGELADALKARGRFPESEVKVIMARLASAIAYLHRHAMVHRDLKLENILLSKNPRDPSDDLFIKVTDFGLSTVRDGVGYDNMMIDFCGTPMYMAPEIIDNKPYTEMCDVWAMGIIMYSLLAGYAPFVSSNQQKLYSIIKAADMKRHFERPGSVWKDISKEAKDCLQKLLHANPAYRHTARKLLDCPWITGSRGEEPNVLELMHIVGEEERSRQQLREQESDDQLSIDSTAASRSREGESSQDEEGPDGVAAGDGGESCCRNGSADQAVTHGHGKVSWVPRRTSLPEKSIAVNRLHRISTEPTLSGPLYERNKMSSSTYPNLNGCLRTTSSSRQISTTTIVKSPLVSTISAPHKHSSAPDASLRPHQPLTSVVSAPRRGARHSTPQQLVPSTRTLSASLINLSKNPTSSNNNNGPRLRTVKDFGPTTAVGGAKSTISSSNQATRTGGAKKSVKKKR